MDIITFFWLLLFSMYESLQVAVIVYKVQFFTFILLESFTILFYDTKTVFDWNESKLYKSNVQVADFIKRGILLSKPKNCSQTIYRLMRGCWKDNPERRCSYDQLIGHLSAYQRTHYRDAASAANADNDWDEITELDF